MAWGLEIESRKHSAKQLVSLAGASSFFLFNIFFILRLVNDRLTRLPPRSVVVYGSCKTRERAPGVPADSVEG